MIDKHIEDFIKYIDYERNYSEHTSKGYVIDLEQYKTYVAKEKLNYLKIKYEDVSKYIKFMKDSGLSPTSINRHLSSLRSFYNYLLKENLVESNVFKLVSSQKKGTRLPNYMKYNEFIEMLNHITDDSLGKRNRALLETLLATGARVSEVVNIKIGDIDFSRNEIKVLGKGNKERICYFGSFCANSLKDYITNSRNDLLKKQKSDYLFINHLGKPLTTRGVRHIIDKIIESSGVDSHVSPHTFRHTFATMLLNEGCDLKSVQELLGHVNLSTTSIYTHITNDRLKDVYLHTHPRSKK